MGNWPDVVILLDIKVNGAHHKFRKSLSEVNRNIEGCNTGSLQFHQFEANSRFSGNPLNIEMNAENPLSLVVPAFVNFFRKIEMVFSEKFFLEK